MSPQGEHRLQEIQKIRIGYNICVEGMIMGNLRIIAFLRLSPQRGISLDIM